MKVHCSDCPEEIEVEVDDLDLVDQEVCPCGHSVVIVSVAEFVPIETPSGKLIEFPRRPGLDRAA